MKGFEVIGSFYVNTGLKNRKLESYDQSWKKQWKFDIFF